MTIGVLAVQGAFIEHEKMLNRLGADCIELRQKEDLDREFDALVLPGGESTVQGKLLREQEMLEPLKKRIKDGMPVLATCAGLILLADSIEGSEEGYFKTLPVTVKRNAYGRQLGSFFMEGDFAGQKVPMTFIRAPYISSAQENVEILATEHEHIVAVKYENQLAMSFHPELNEDTFIHEMFLKMAEKNVCNHV